jgi:hypothetical protein
VLPGLFSPHGCKAWEAWNTGGADLENATNRLVSSRPVTAAGAAALMRHWAEFITAEHDGDLFDNEQTAQFMDNVINALLARCDRILIRPGTVGVRRRGGGLRVAPFFAGASWSV